MKVSELLCTFSKKDINKIYYQSEDITDLLDFVIEYSITFDTLKEFNFNLSKIVDSILENYLMYDDEMSDYNVRYMRSIIKDFSEVFEKDVYVQDFVLLGCKLTNYEKINIVLS